MTSARSGKKASMVMKGRGGGRGGGGGGGGGRGGMKRGKYD